MRIDFLDTAGWVAFIVYLALLFWRHGYQLNVDRKNRGRDFQSLDVRDNGLVVIVLCWSLLHLSALSAVWGSRAVAPDWSISLGLVVIASGAWCGVLAIRELAANYNIAVGLYANHQLVDTGVYSVVRHPIRVGIILEGFGATMIVWNVGSIALFVLLFFCLLRRTEVEERILVAHFGSEYVTKLSEIPRFNIFWGIIRRIAFR